MGYAKIVKLCVMVKWVEPLLTEFNYFCAVKNSTPMNETVSPQKTEDQFKKVTGMCRDLFVKKMRDYGTSWRVMRPSSLTDQIYIKARRIRSLQEKGASAVAEGIEPEFIGIVNYCAMAMIQCGPEGGRDFTEAEAAELYDNAIAQATSLMLDKNHDYDEAWRHMRVSSFTDIILQKLLRTRQIEDHGGRTLVSEGVEANYMDMINYAIFALIKLGETGETR